MNPAPRFLTIEDILTLHAIAIEDQGGDPSIRDRTLLESAIATPAQQFGGQYLHADIPAMAAAYAFHICMNHPFVDGNKRAGTAAMIAFLSDNGWSFNASADEAEPAILRLAAGESDKAAFTEWARRHMHEKPRIELREFMLSLSPEALKHHFAAVSSTPSLTEIEATIEEACRNIPCIGVLRHTVKTAVDAGDLESARVLELHATLLTALYRIAEDMGYEW